ncbi:hypothetical protein GIB67_002543 [Kingdonia uniflora]|uniref:SPARK domain-containing protein n=1 Tax=Kingdonia uniflora TaxID=39325 RepID=A0A7J7N9G9_9MAGN|nr:hypothetical protein GIB67_002543 [Kingdonia uniflora]
MSLLLSLISPLLFLLLFHLPLSLQTETQPFFPKTPHPTNTIPAFPEQSSQITSCKLDLPQQLFRDIDTACGPKTPLSRTHCCPILAAWLYSAYSTTSLSGAGVDTSSASPYDLPVLPDDSETCVYNLEKALKGNGVELRKPNETCDLVYCYCGIRLHPLSCPEVFSVSKQGKELVGDDSVRLLERDCLKYNVDGHSSLAGCSKCLNQLYQLNETKSLDTSKSDRKNKMHNRDCELMGLTWLLAKNRTAYIPVVSAVLKAFMMNTDDYGPQSCILTSDGLPLAVDSVDIDNQSSSNTLQPHTHLVVIFLSFVYVYIILSSLC